MTSCGRPSPTPLAVGCSTSWSATVTSVPAGWPDAYRSPRQAVSKHLVVLEQAGLISRRKQGREVLYQVDADRLDQATRAMADLAAQWDRRLATIKRLAEAAHDEARKKRGL
jgi:hypothetical protein